LTGCLSHLWGQFRTKITPPWKLFFSEENQYFLFHNFNRATYGGLKNRIFEEKKLTGCLSRLLCHKFTEICGQNYTAAKTYFFSRKSIYFKCVGVVRGVRGGGLWEVWGVWAVWGVGRLHLLRLWTPTIFYLIKLILHIFLIFNF
jgi:hypothetical protein